MLSYAALVLALLAGGLRYARGTWDAAARLQELAGSDTAETFLRARLAEAMPLYEQRHAGTVRSVFDGTSDALSFVAPAPNGPAGAGLYRYTLEVTGAGPERRALMVKLAPYLAGSSDPGVERVPQQYEIMRGIKSVSYRYFGPGRLNAQPSWHTAWTRTDAMPNLVEIAIARDGGEGGPISLVIGLPLQPRPR